MSCSLIRTTNYATPTAIALKSVSCDLGYAFIDVVHGVHSPRQVEQVPTATGETTALAPIDADPTRITVAPWRFRLTHVGV